MRSDKRLLERCTIIAIELLRSLYRNFQSLIQFYNISEMPSCLIRHQLSCFLFWWYTKDALIPHSTIRYDRYREYIKCDKTFIRLNFYKYLSLHISGPRRLAGKTQICRGLRNLHNTAINPQELDITHEYAQQIVELTPICTYLSEGVRWAKISTGQHYSSPIGT